MLRKTVQRTVIDALDRSFFTSSDFEIYFESPSDSEDAGYLFLIVFAHDSNYWFSANQSKHINVHRQPGDVEAAQYDRYYTLEECLLGLTSWCNEIREEIRADAPGYDELDKLKDLIGEQIKTENANADEFSVSEITDLINKFDALIQRVEKLEKD